MKLCDTKMLVALATMAFKELLDAYPTVCNTPRYQAWLKKSKPDSRPFARKIHSEVGYLPDLWHREASLYALFCPCCEIYVRPKHFGVTGSRKLLFRALIEALLLCVCLFASS